MKGSFPDKLSYLLNERQLSRRQFLIDLGLNKNQFHRWEQGTPPMSRTVSSIADYFMVTPVSLTDPERDIEYTFTATPVTPDMSLLPLTEQEKYILNMYREVSPTTQMRMAQAIMNLYDKENEQ